MPRCLNCGAVIPGHDCVHCPSVKTVNCPGCGASVTIVNEAKRVEFKATT